MSRPQTNADAQRRQRSSEVSKEPYHERRERVPQTPPRSDKVASKNIGACGYRTNHERKSNACRMERITCRVTPCKHTEPTEHTECSMQHVFWTENKLRTDKKRLNLLPQAHQKALAIPGRLELPTCGLGNRRSIRLSYGTGRIPCSDILQGRREGSSSHIRRHAPPPPCPS